MDEVSHTELQSPAPPSEDGGMARPPWLTRQRRLGLAIVVALALAALLPPWLNVGRFKRKIAASISGSIGRPVHMDRVGLRLLPAPAFTLENFVVGEDPAFGAEPVMRSPSVTATLHISSLWRGRLEFASISLDEASVNLVRNPSGMWNAEGILLQASQVATAPTAQKRAGSLPRFPYIEADNARVNIKLGDEKLPLSFVDAKFTLWLSGPGHWQARMEARPIRTDLNMSDTGTIRIEGELQSAAILAAVPLNLRMEWKGAQLGEATRLLTGRDEGWRGALTVASQIQGTVGDASLNASTGVTGLRRAEFFPNKELDLRLDCAAHGLGNFDALDDIHCALPIDGGDLALTGSVDGLKSRSQAVLALRIHQIPAQSALDILRHANNRIDPGLSTEGMLDGIFHYGPTGATLPIGDVAPAPPPHWTGEAGVSRLVLRAPNLDQPLVMKDLRLTTGIADDGIDRDIAGDQRRTTKGRRQGPNQRPKTRSSGQPASGVPAGLLALLPVDLPLGAAQPAVLSGSFGPEGYSFQARGGAALTRLLELNSTFHLLHGSLQGLQPAGTADLNMTLKGPWEPAAPLEIPATAINPPTQPHSFLLTGSMQLMGARMAMSGAAPTPDSVGSDSPSTPQSTANGMIGIATAHLEFADNAVSWSGIAANYAGLRLEGGMKRPLGCSAAAATVDESARPADPNASEVADACSTEFNLIAGNINLGSVEVALSTPPAKRSLLDLFSPPQAAMPHWPAAHGTLRIDTLSIGPLVLSNALVEMSFQGSRATIQSLTATALDGRVDAKVKLDVAPPARSFDIDASLRGIHVAAASALFHEHWGAATGDAHCLLHLEGASNGELRKSAKGKCDWALRDGKLNVVSRRPASSSPATSAEGVTAAAAAESASQVARSRSETVFQQWRGEATVADGRLTIATSQAKTPHSTASVSGIISFDRGVEIQWGAMRLYGRLEGSTNPSPAYPASPSSALSSATEPGAAEPDAAVTGERSAQH